MLRRVDEIFQTDPNIQDNLKVSTKLKGGWHENTDNLLSKYVPLVP